MLIFSAVGSIIAVSCSNLPIVSGIVCKNKCVFLCVLDSVRVKRLRVVKEIIPSVFKVLPC